MDTGRTLGKCVARRDGRFELQFTTRIDMPEDTLDDIIIHEMIHLFIGYNGLCDSSPHGRLFKALMESINERYGRHITISVALTSEQREQAAGTRRTWRVIAAMELADGRCAVKVLPKVKEHIDRYRQAAFNDSAIRSISFFFHDNPFFNRYPRSASLRYHIIDRTELNENLRGAKQI